MSEINKEQCGAFIAALRKEKGWTQKELAEKLFVSDKAVSKWERGLSLPDVSLLEPMSELLGASILELLRGERLQPQNPMSPDQVERLMAETVHLSTEEKARVQMGRRKWKMAYAICAFLSLAQVGGLLSMGFSAEEMESSVFLVVGLSMLFGAWLCFWARERLPAYYDQNKISFYGDGVFRMNLAGVHFNNSNWPHILNAMRGWLLGAMVVYPVLWWALRSVLRENRLTIELPLTLFFCLGMMIPAYVVGKKYE